MTPAFIGHSVSTSSTVSELGSTYSISRVNLFRLSRNSLLPPWWKCKAGRAVGESFSLKIKKVQPSFFTVTDFSSVMLKFNAQRFLSWLWFTQPDRRRNTDKNTDAGAGGTHPPPLLRCFGSNVLPNQKTGFIAALPDQHSRFGASSPMSLLIFTDQ